MTYPNPAGYYLPLPEAIELEITSLDISGLKALLAELACFLEEEDQLTFLSDYLDPLHSTFIWELSSQALTDLIRWVAERLAYLAHGTTNEA